jgi:hypothetical protein
MLTMLTTTIKNIVKEAKSNGQDIHALAERLDSDMVDILITFCGKHPEFHTYRKAIELYDLGKGHWGSFCRYTGEVHINSELVNGLAKRIAIGTGEDLAYKFVETMLHEHRHAYQYKHKLPMTKVQYVDASVDYQAYYNHPMEVDAREYAKAYAEDAICYLVCKLAKIYRESTI